MIRAVLMDCGETLIERISDEAEPLSRLDLKRFPDALPTVQLLDAAGFLLAIVSNTEQSDAREMRRALAAIGLSEYFDVVVTSVSVMHRKPDPVIFERALELLGCSSTEAVMVGDDPETDIAGGAALGLPTILVHRTATEVTTTTATFTVASLLEIPGILLQLNAPSTY